MDPQAGGRPKRAAAALTAQAFAAAKKRAWRPRQHRSPTDDGSQAPDGDENELPTATDRETAAALEALGHAEGAGSADDAAAVAGRKRKRSSAGGDGYAAVPPAATGPVSSSYCNKDAEQLREVIAIQPMLQALSADSPDVGAGSNSPIKPATAAEEAVACADGAESMTAGATRGGVTSSVGQPVERLGNSESSVALLALVAAQAAAAHVDLPADSSDSDASQDEEEAGLGDEMGLPDDASHDASISPAIVAGAQTATPEDVAGQAIIDAIAKAVKKPGLCWRGSSHFALTLVGRSFEHSGIGGVYRTYMAGGTRLDEDKYFGKSKYFLLTALRAIESGLALQAWRENVPELRGDSRGRAQQAAAVKVSHAQILVNRDRLHAAAADGASAAHVSSGATQTQVWNWQYQRVVRQEGEPILESAAIAAAPPPQMGADSSRKHVSKKQLEQGTQLHQQQLQKAIAASPAWLSSVLQRVQPSTLVQLPDDAVWRFTALLHRCYPYHRGHQPPMPELPRFETPAALPYPTPQLMASAGCWRLAAECVLGISLGIISASPVIAVLVGMLSTGPPPRRNSSWSNNASAVDKAVNAADILAYENDYEVDGMSPHTFHHLMTCLNQKSQPIGVYQGFRTITAGAWSQTMGSIFHELQATNNRITAFVLYHSGSNNDVPAGYARLGWYSALIQAPTEGPGGAAEGSMYYYDPRCGIRRFAAGDPLPVDIPFFSAQRRMAFAFQVPPTFDATRHKAVTDALELMRRRTQAAFEVVFEGRSVLAGNLQPSM